MALPPSAKTLLSRLRRRHVPGDNRPGRNLRRYFAAADLWRQPREDRRPSRNSQHLSTRVKFHHANSLYYADPPSFQALFLASLGKTPEVRLLFLHVWPPAACARLILFLFDFFFFVRDGVCARQYHSGGPKNSENMQPCHSLHKEPYTSCGLRSNRELSRFSRRELSGRALQGLPIMIACMIYKSWIFNRAAALKKSVLRLAFVFAVMGSGAFSARAHPYASGLTNNAGIISFILNEAANDVSVIFNSGAATNDLGALSSGVQSFSLAGYTNYSIVVTKTGSGSISQISVDATNNDFYGPRGIAVNNNPQTPQLRPHLRRQRQCRRRSQPHHHPRPLCSQRRYVRCPGLRRRRQRH